MDLVRELQGSQDLFSTCDMILATKHMRLICSRRLHIPADVLMLGFVAVDPRAVFTVFVQKSEPEGIAPNGRQSEH